MYVALMQNSYVHQLIPVSKQDFERAARWKFTGTPVYSYEAPDGKVSVWPAPEIGTSVCRLVHQELTELK